MKKGFTIVELAIAMVIIGLLIGGILVAQSIKSTVKINSQIKQFQQFDIAISNFKTRFGGLPGDNSATFSSGNNDGVITTATNCYSLSNEFGSAWKVLSSTQNLVDGCPYSSWNGAPADPQGCVSMPFAKLSGAHDSSAKDRGVIIYGSPSNSTNYYTFEAFPTGMPGNCAVVMGSISSVDMSALDLKMDDGLPATGKMVSRIGWGSFLYDTSLNTSSPCVIGGTAYKTTGASIDYACYLRLEILSQTGGAQN